MLIPIGFFGGAAAGAYELISTAYSDGTSNNITFTSIPQTYKHLELRWVAKDSGSTTTTLRISFNGLSTGYAYHRLSGNGSAVTSAGSAAQTYIVLNGAMATSTTANIYAAGILNIADYSNANKTKVLRSLNGNVDAASFVGLQSGLQTTTGAITSLTIAGQISPNTLSRFSLYGIKG